MSTAETCRVYWLDPWAWDKELELVALPLEPPPVNDWLNLLFKQGWKVMLLPYDARIVGGPCDGRQYVAVPPEAIPALYHLLPFADYRALLGATPALIERPAARTGRTP